MPASVPRVRAAVILCLCLPVMAAVSCGTEDPKATERAAAQKRIDDAGTKLASIARQAGGDPAATAAELRQLASQMQSVPGASPGQQQAAATIAASAARQAGMLELANARRLEAASARARALAVRLASVAALAQAEAEVTGSAGAGDSATLDEARELASAARAAFEEAQSALESARSRATEAADARAAASAEADALRTQSLSADAGQAHRLIVESAQRRDAAREAMLQAQEAEAEATLGESTLRMATLGSESTQRQAAAIEAALDAVSQLNSAFGARQSGAQETVRTMQVRITELLDSSDPAAMEAFTASVQRALEDFDRSASLIQRATPSGSDRGAQASAATARASADLSRALAHRTMSDASLAHARALAAVGSAPGAAGSRPAMQQAQDALAKATEAHSKSKEAYAAAQEGLGRAGDSSAVRDLRASLTASMADLADPSLDLPKAPEPAPAAAAAAAGGSPAAASAPVEVTPPPHATAEALVAYLSSEGFGKDEAAMRAVLVGKRPTAKPFLDAMIALNAAGARLEQAMSARFGSAGGGLGASVGAAASLGGAGTTIKLISVEGDAGSISMKGAMAPAIQVAIRKSGTAWVVDLDDLVTKSGPMGQMMPGMVGSFVPAIDSVTDRIKSGELTTAAAAQNALGQAMQEAFQKAMGGGMAGPG